MSNFRIFWDIRYLNPTISTSRQERIVVFKASLAPSEQSGSIYLCLSDTNRNCPVNVLISRAYVHVHGTYVHAHTYILVWGTSPFARERKGLVTSLYLRCPDVWNVDMTYQITVWSSTLISPRTCTYFATNFLCHHGFQVKGDCLCRRWRTWLRFHKPEQERALLSFLRGHDVFISLPTSYGRAFVMLPYLVLLINC